VLAVWLCAGVVPGVASAQDEPTAREVEVYSEKMKVPKDAAKRHLNALHRGARLPDDLRDRLGSDYASEWWDKREGRWKVAAASAEGEAAARELLRERRLEAEVDVVRVARTHAQLLSAQLVLQVDLTDLLERQLVYLKIDPSANTAVIVVHPDADALSRERVDRAVHRGGGAVESRTGERNAFTVAPSSCTLSPGEGPGAASGCYRPLRMGVAVQHQSGSYCTAGAKARDSSGNLFVLTAGHCVVSRTGTWTAWDTGQPPGYNRRRLGWTSGGIYNQYGDGGRIHVDPSGWWNQVAWPHALVSWGYFDYRVLQGKARPAYNQVGCHNGASSGTQCGYVNGIDVYRCYADNTCHGNLTEWRDACGLLGDSGGPWAWHYTTFSLHSASSKCYAAKPHVSYSFDLAHAEYALGVSVLIGQ